MKIPVKRIASFLAAAFMTACAGAMPDARLGGNEADKAESLSASFNRQAVADVYEKSCSVRDAERKYKIDRHHFSLRTPSYFWPRGTELALFSPRLTPEQVKDSQAVLDSLPRHVMDLFYPLGGVALFPRDTVVEAIPSFGGIKKNGRFPYYQSVIGVYFDSNKRVHMTFNTAIVEKRDGKAIVKGYRPVTDDKFMVFHHETGHFIDDVLGELGSSFWEFGQTEFSDREEFVRALKQDLDDLAIANLSYKELIPRSYYLPKEHNGVKLYGQHDSAEVLRGEVFAGLWAEVQGHSNYDLKKILPRTFKLVNDVNADLKRPHAAYGSECGYKGYTPAAAP